MRTRILITGVLGFIGSHVLRELQETHHVTGLDVAPQSHVPMDRYIGMKLPDSALPEVIREARPDVIVHCAGHASVGFSLEHPDEDFEAGPVSVFHLLDALRKSGSKPQLIFLSSAAVYGNPGTLPVTRSTQLQPVSPYGFHKMISEQVFREFEEIFGIPAVILRVFSCYGAGLRKQLLWDICRKACASGPVRLFGTGNETRDYIHVRDLARLIALLIRKRTRSGVFNVGTGSQTTVREVAETILNEMGLPSDTLRFSGENRAGDPLFWQADVTPLQELEFEPSIPMSKGIVDYVRWFSSLQDSHA